MPISPLANNNTYPPVASNQSTTNSDASTNTANTTTDNSSPISKSLNLNTNMYMTLFLQSLQNQSPFDTMDNNQMMQQMSQLGFMEQVDNMKKAIQDLETIEKGQQLQNAGNLLGKTLVAVNSDGQKVVGEATAFRITNGVVQYLVNNQVIQAPDIQEVGITGSNDPSNTNTNGTQTSDSGQTNSQPATSQTSTSNVAS